MEINCGACFQLYDRSKKSKGIAKANDMVVKTIVTTDLIDEIAKEIILPAIMFLYRF
jgi:hypothetical protein